MATVSNEDFHVSRIRLLPVQGELIYLGADFGLTPCITIGQPAGYGEIRILASLPCERGGIKQHLENSVPVVEAARHGCLKHQARFTAGMTRAHPTHRTIPI